MQMALLTAYQIVCGPDPSTVHTPYPKSINCILLCSLQLVHKKKAISGEGEKKGCKYDVLTTLTNFVIKWPTTTKKDLK